MAEVGLARKTAVVIKPEDAGCLVLDFVGFNAVKMLFYSAVLNGLAVVGKNTQVSANLGNVVTRGERKP